MNYGYARVSTRGQFAHGYSLDDQKAQLKSCGCQLIVVEQYTGTTTERPQLQRLIQKLHPNDVLTVTKLDRLARTASEGNKLIAQLLKNDVKVHILNMGIIDDTPIGRLILNILLAFAEFERDLIIERTQAGKAIARQKPGYHEGRPPLPIQTKQKAVLLHQEGHTYKEISVATGLSRSTIIRACKQAEMWH